MRIIYFFVLVFFGVGAVGQVISFPNANFKLRLLSATPQNNFAYSGGIAVKIDINNDSQIQVAEAAVLDSLNLSSASISNLSGIEYFTGLKKLEFQYNGIATANLSALTSLEILFANSSSLSTLNVNGLIHLKQLYCHSNNLSSLDVSSLIDLEILFAAGNPLTTLSIQSLPNLKNLAVYDTSIAALDLSQSLQLMELACFRCPITSLELTNNMMLETLACEGTLLTSLDVSNHPSLNYLRAEGSQFDPGLITYLNVSNCPQLETLVIPWNQLSTLNLTGCPQLQFLRVHNNVLTELDVSGTAISIVYANNNNLTTINSTSCSELSIIDLRFNQLETVDFSDNHLLSNVKLSGNPLATLFVKNGSAESFDTLNMPTLEYVCADEWQVEYLQNQLSGTGVVVNSYCSITPGGNYNTITGKPFRDDNANGCDPNDTALPRFKLDVSNGIDHDYAFSNNSGVYNAFVPDGEFSITPVPEEPSYWTIEPSTVNFANTDYNVETRNFCLLGNGIHPDAEVTIVPVGQPRPGEDMHYYIFLKNKGNQPVSGNLVFNFDDAVYDFLSSSYIPASVSSGAIIWDIYDMAPFELRTFYLTLNLNGPTETPAVNLDDTVAVSAAINLSVPDDMPGDNTSETTQTVVGSFDPNNKLCLEGSLLPVAKIGDYLHYVINYENTGTAQAHQVVITDEIDAEKYDLSSLQVIAMRHAGLISISGNELKFTCANLTFQPHDPAFVLFKIRTKNTLEAEASVSNKANIYFDYNFPIETNEAIATFSDLGSRDFSAVQASLYPNPVDNSMTVKANENIMSVSIYDLQARPILFKESASIQKEISADVSNLSSGTYFVKVTTASGWSNLKFVKK